MVACDILPIRDVGSGVGHFPPGHSPPTNDEVCYMRMTTLRCKKERLNRPLCGIIFTKYIKYSCYFEL